jgi:hypothetical protein
MGDSDGYGGVGGCSVTSASPGNQTMRSLVRACSWSNDFELVWGEVRIINRHVSARACFCACQLIRTYQLTRFLVC